LKKLGGDKHASLFCFSGSDKEKNLFKLDVQVEQQREMEGLLEVRKPVQTGLNQRPIL
jgi:hypothetical protein